MQAEKKAFIEFMLQSDVLRFGSFTTKSGRQTPYFVNTGNYRTGGQISRLGDFYAKKVADTCADDFTALFGPAYKGIPLVTTCAGALARNHGIDKPYFFNRKEAKDHGEGGSIVGYQPKDGDSVIIIEDVITAGTAMRESIEVLKAYGKIATPHVFISVNRCEMGNTPGRTAIMDVMEEFGMQVHALVDVTDVLAYLEDSGQYRQLLPEMRAYMDKYCVL